MNGNKKFNHHQHLHLWITQGNRPDSTPDLNILEGQVRLPEITSITLIPNDDDQAGTDEDSDDDENLEPKSMDRFGRGILNVMAEIDFLDENEELPDVTEVNFCVIILYF